MTKTKPENLLIGAHTSAAGGVFNALLQGEELGATTIQLFTANQKTWKGKPITDEIADKWHAVLKETGIKKVMSHDSYLINLGSPKEEGLAKSRHAFADEIKRCVKLGVTYLNFHPGAALDDSREACIERIAKSLIQTAPLLEGSETMLLLETTAGQGTTIGYRFEELQAIIELVDGQVPLGVCMDTCHSFCAGYDMRSEAAWEETIKEFDKTVGMKHLKAFHVNDSLKPFASRRDRHANLGEGEIGIECFKVMMRHPKLREIPKYLETPNGEERWADEIAMLRKFAQ